MDTPSVVPELHIQGVEFADDYAAIQIAYVEGRNVSDKGYKREVLVLDASVFPKDEVSDVIDTLAQWIDVGLLHLRQQ